MVLELIELNYREGIWGLVIAKSRRSWQPFTRGGVWNVPSSSLDCGYVEQS